MELIRIIDTVDSLYPNPFTLEEKIRWCDEVSAIIRRQAKKIYDTISINIGSGRGLELPDDIAFEDVEVAYLNGKAIDKMDFRSLLTDVPTLDVSYPARLEIVYLTKPMTTRIVSIKGEFDVSENFIKIDSPDLYPGDLIEWVELDDTDAEPDWSRATSCYILDRVYDGLVVEDNTFSPQTAMPLAIRRVFDDVTEIDEIPYDNLYVEYILAKMAFYQQDYTAYNAHIDQYNILWDNLRRDYKSRAPLSDVSNFHKFWQI